MQSNGAVKLFSGAGTPTREIGIPARGVRIQTSGAAKLRGERFLDGENNRAEGAECNEIRK
jgi:hypothetical protein